jgi:hypothetical protein
VLILIRIYQSGVAECKSALELLEELKRIIELHGMAKAELAQLFTESMRARVMVKGDQATFRTLLDILTSALYPWLVAEGGDLHVSINGGQFVAGDLTILWKVNLQRWYEEGGKSWFACKDFGSLARFSGYDQSRKAVRPMLAACQLAAMLTYENHHPGEAFTLADVAAYTLREGSGSDEMRKAFAHWTFLDAPLFLVYAEVVVRSSDFKARMSLLKIMWLQCISQRPAKAKRSTEKPNGSETHEGAPSPEDAGSENSGEEGSGAAKSRENKALYAKLCLTIQQMWNLGSPAEREEMRANFTVKTEVANEAASHDGTHEHNHARVAR